MLKQLNGGGALLQVKRRSFFCQVKKKEVSGTVKSTDKLLKQMNLCCLKYICVFFFVRQNRWTKRGLAIVPTKFGISFTAVFLNQVWSNSTIEQTDKGWMDYTSRVCVVSWICISPCLCVSAGWSSGSYLHRRLGVVDPWWDGDGTGTPHQDGPGTWDQQTITLVLSFF